MTGTPEGSSESGFMEKPGIEHATPGLQGIALIHYTTGASLKLFMAFPRVEAGRVYDLCVYYMTGTPEGSTKSGFIEKPGIEPATPGLKGIALIHYTTGASQKRLMNDEAMCTWNLYDVIRITRASPLYQMKVIFQPRPTST